MHGRESGVIVYVQIEYLLFNWTFSSVGEAIYVLGVGLPTKHLHIIKGLDWNRLKDYFY